jgi:transposase InsO family protein
MNLHVALTSTTMSIEELHHRYGHLNYNDLMLLQRKTMIEGLHVMKNDHFPCEACALGKQHRKEFPIHTEKRQIDIPKLIHIDVCRPMQTRSLGGASYFLIFVDDRSRYTWVYFIRRKSDVFEYFKEFITITEKQTGKCIKVLRSDEGGEYTSGAFKSYCKFHGIQQQFTVPHTPQQNRVVDRRNRTLVECARGMLQGKNISNGFWAEVVNIVVYLKNRSPTKKLDFQTPSEILYGYKPDVSHLRVFGSSAFAHIPKDERRKLDANSIKCVFIGYCTDQKAYKLFDPSSHKLFASRDVMFHENADGVDTMKDADAWHNDSDAHVKIHAMVKQEQVQVQVQERNESSMDTSSSQDTSSGEKSLQSRRQDESSEGRRRSSRQTQPPIRYKYYALMSHVMNVVEPVNYDQAKEHEEWRNAMNDEYDSLMKNQTWELVELPKNKVPTGSKW